MKAKNLGIFASLFASICCLGPLILVLVGLGSLGIGAAIGKHHWWFLSGGILLLIIAWRYYFKEKKSCDLTGCQMRNKRLTQIILTTATVVVVFFVGLNLYPNLSKSPRVRETTVPASAETVTIPIEGMSCFTCEITVASALKNVDGVINASASVNEKTATVTYYPEKTDINRLIEAINGTGYKASMPK